MLKNYLKIAFRHLRKSKTYSFINITGLSAGLAVSMLLLLWVNDELSFDRFNKHAASLYQLSPTFENASGGNVWGTTPGPIGPYAKKEVPEVEAFCRLNEKWDITYFMYEGRKIVQWNNQQVDPSFFSMFSYPLIEGDPEHPFKDAQSIVISESVAKRIFGNEDPMGKVLTGDDKELCTVTGVMKDMPENSSIKFDIAFNFLQMERDTVQRVNGNWGQFNYTTYVLLKRGANAVAVGAKLAAIHQRNQQDDFSKHLGYRLNPITKLHLYALDGKEQGMMVVKVFFIVAVIVLLIACINYVNLVTARAIKRSKEISLRKIVGAGKGSLFVQFLSESLIIFLIALVVATGIIYLVMPLYNDIAGKNIVFAPWSPGVLAVYGLALLATLLLAGIYPAITLSSFKPLEAMKGKLSGIGSKGSFRKVLVVVQFSFSIMLIASTIVIGKQLKYIREKNLGWDRRNVFSFYMRNIDSHYAAVKAELLKEPGILGVTESGRDIVNTSSSTSSADWDGKRADQNSYTITQLPVETNFLDVMGIKLVEGKGFTGGPADSTNYILNETAIREAGISEPVVGKRFTLHGHQGVIAGVAKDFHYEDMHKKIRPIIIYYSTDWRWKIFVKTTGKDAPRALAAVRKVWARYNPDYDLLYTFLDTQFDELYKTDTHVGVLFNCFAVLAICISCLGLFGLVTFTAESKLKEIGVRKVLGAGVAQIVGLLARDFLWLVVVAAAVAIPVAWYGLSGFLQGYAYQTTLSWWVFGIAGAVTLVIALGTISFKCVQAALANPVKSLRTE
jgi:putative ABC transport system permease protein